MISIPGFKLHSFAIGCKHVRCFSLSSVSGVIADYLLGECSANNHVFPKNHYEQVTFSQGQVKLTDEDEINIFEASWDQLYISEKVKSRGEEFHNTQGVLKRAKSVFPAILSLQKDPNVVFLGIVCTFVKDDDLAKSQSRFHHPAADLLSKKLLPYSIKNGEVSSQVALRHTYRSKIPSSFITKGSDDYHNIILNIRDDTALNIWKDQGKTKDDVKVEDERLCTLSFDIQRVFDPRRKYEPKLFDEHANFFKKQMNGRIKEILKEIGFNE